MLVIVDIDLTLADARSRLSAAGRMPHRDEKANFQQWLDTLQSDKSLLQDPPVSAVCFLVKDLSRSNEIVYLTGRSTKYYEVTRLWLRDNDLPWGELFMRGHNDFRSAKDYKEEKVKQLLARNPNKLAVAIDDDSEGDCSEAYRKLGVVHLKVIL